MTLPMELGIDATTAKEVAPQLAKLKQTSEAMESHFVKEMLQAMKKAMPDTSEGEGFGNDEYQDMFDEAVSNALSHKSGLGIAETVYKSLAPAAFQQQRRRVLQRLGATGSFGGKS
jgi:Rod binding domain-containing protein